MDWQENSIIDGEFTVPEDRDVVVQLGEKAVKSGWAISGQQKPFELSLDKAIQRWFTSSEVSKTLLVNDMNPFASICYRVIDAHLLR